MNTLKSLWDSIRTLIVWEDYTLLAAVLATVLTSIVFIWRMIKYKNKNALDNLLILREFGWFLIGFRFLTAVAFDWDWSSFSWLLWLFVALSTIGAYIASQREHIIGGYDDGDVEQLD